MIVKIKSRPLLAGGKIGVVAPGSPIHSEAELELAITNLTRQGYQVRLGETVKPQSGYLAGDDLKRAQDLEKMWRDGNVTAIWCLRGGFGSLRLLGHLDYEYIAEHPKVLVGFSDVTALELALWARIRLVTFHGPVLSRFQTDFSQQAARKMLSGEFMPGNCFAIPSGEPPAVLHSGRAEGILLGGNLATMCSMIGTGYLPDFRDAILFIEEVGEAAYRVDRMLTQFEMNGGFEGIRGLMIGRCIPAPGENEAELIRVFEEKLGNLNCPIAYGFPVGHHDEQWTLPQGVKIGMDLEDGEVALLEPALDMF